METVCVVLEVKMEVELGVLDLDFKLKVDVKVFKIKSDVVG